MIVVRLFVWGAWMAMCMSVSGCGATDSGPLGNPGPSRVAALESGLRSKPSFEEAKTEYSAQMDRIAQEITDLVPGITWHVEENSWRGCGGDYAWTRARQVYYYIVFDQPIPDSLWPRALQIVKDGAARLGATTVDILVDQPHNRDLTIPGADGEEFEFGTAKQTILSAKSDCRMRETDTATSTPKP
jgi:hypothetical protein